MTAPVGSFSSAAHVRQFQALSPDVQRATIEGLRQVDPSEAERLISASGYVGSAAGTRQRIDLTQPTSSSAPATAGPRGRVPSSRARGGYADIQPDASVSYRDANGRTRRCSGAVLGERLDRMRESNPTGYNSFMSSNGLRLTDDGRYQVAGSRVAAERARGSSTTAAAGGGGSYGITSGAVTSGGGGGGGSSFGVSPWLAGGVGLLTGGIFGGVAAFMGASALQGAMGGGGGGFGMTGVAAAGLGGAAPIANAFGLSTEGLQFQLRAQMNSIARERQLDSMIGMFHSGMPIEDLIFYFLMFMGERYEDKLKEKMEEAAISEKLQERQQRRTNQANMASGLVSMIPVYGQFAAAGIQQGASKMNELEGALNGNMKSGTALANEVQMLLHKWKAMTELCSNLLKAMHDMQMTPIRNLR